MKLLSTAMVMLFAVNIATAQNNDELACKSKIISTTFGAPGLFFESGQGFRGRSVGIRREAELNLALIPNGTLVSEGLKVDNVIEAPSENGTNKYTHVANYKLTRSFDVDGDEDAHEVVLSYDFKLYNEYNKNCERISLAGESPIAGEEVEELLARDQALGHNDFVPRDCTIDLIFEDVSSKDQGRTKERLESLGYKTSITGETNPANFLKLEKSDSGFLLCEITYELAKYRDVLSNSKNKQGSKRSLSCKGAIKKILKSNFPECVPTEPPADMR